MTTALKNMGLIILTILLSYLLGIYFGLLYSSFFLVEATGFFSIPKEAGLQIFGTAFSYTFFLPLLFTAFGGAKKYWWIGIGLIPALAFELYFDLAHIYFPLALGLVGWVIGFGLSRILVLSRRAP